MVVKRRFSQNVLVFLLLSGALLLTAGWVRMPQAATLSVKGQVTNGTPGGEVPTGLEVSLHAFAGGKEVETLTIPLAADGSFVFEGVTAGEDRTFVAQVTYQGVDYFSEAVAPASDQRELELPIVIYETTEEPTSVQVAQLHIFVTGMEGRLMVEEYFLIGNEGDRTYIGAADPEVGDRVTVRFTLPEGAEDLTFDGPGLGERFVEQAGGFADTRPIPPGSVTSEVVFYYTLPYREGLQVEQAVDVPVKSVVILMVQGDLALEGAGLEPMGTVDTQMGPALSYVGGPLAAGESLAFTLVAAPPPVMEPSVSTDHPAVAPTRNVTRETAVGLAALALAVMGAALLWRPPAPGPVPSRVRPLVEQIAALDREYELGRVPEETYLERREKLKQRTLALWKQQEEDTASR